MTTAQTQGGEGKAVDKFNGAVLGEIDGLVQEYVGAHNIFDSPDSTKRINLVNRREDALGKIREGLEGIVTTALGDRIYADKSAADRIIEGLVVKGYEVDKLKLPEDPQKRKERIAEYLARAGVDYTQLVKQIIDTRRPTKIDQLPEDHLLRRLVTYLQHQSHEQQRRIDYIQQRLISLGDIRAPAVAEAFNKHAGLRLDPRYAKPQEAFQIYGTMVQAQRAAYEANAPEKIHNTQVRKAA